jgi:hypothetical protein
MSRKQVSDVVFVKAVIAKDEDGNFINKNCKDVGIALKGEAGGEPLKPNSVYNRLQKLRKSGVKLPNLPMKPLKNSASVEDLNALIGE